MHSYHLERQSLTQAQPKPHTPIPACNGQAEASDSDQSSIPAGVISSASHREASQVHADEASSSLSAATHSSRAETASQPATVSQEPKGASQAPDAPAANRGQPDTGSAVQTEAAAPSWVHLRARLAHLFSPEGEAYAAAASGAEGADAGLEPAQPPADSRAEAGEHADSEPQDQLAEPHAASRSPAVSQHASSQTPEKALAPELRPEQGECCLELL